MRSLLRQWNVQSNIFYSSDSVEQNIINVVELKQMKEVAKMANMEVEKMVKKALKDEGYHIKPIKDQYNINKYIVINSDNVVQTDEHGMSFAELAAYAGLHYPM